MASTATSESSSSLLNQMSTFTGNLQSDIGIQKAALGKAADKEVSDVEAEHSSYQNDMSKFADSFQKLQKEGADIKPFEAPKKQDPLQSWGALISGAMGIVSIATGKSMVASLNAGAASINAVKANNDEEYTKAYEAWKSNTDFAFKQLNWENDQIKTGLDMVEKNHAEGVAYIRSVFAARQDGAGQVALDTQGIEGVKKLLDARTKVQTDGIENADRLEDLHEKKLAMDNYKDWIKQNPAATPEQKQDMLNRAMGKYSTSASSMAAQDKENLFSSMKSEKEKQLGRPLKPDEELAIYKQVNAKDSPITGNEKVKLEARVNQFDDSLDKIDEAMDVLNKNVLSAGVTGKARRLGESVGNVLGSNATDLNQFRRNLEYIQTMAKRLMTDAQGRPLSADAKKIDDIVGGLSIGDTTANTQRALQEIKELYNKDRSDTVSQLQGTWAADGSSPDAGGGKPNPAPPPAEKPSATPWANDPVVGH